MAKLVNTILTLGKVLLKSRPAGRSRRRDKGGRLIIMGNGPSLRQTIEENGEKLLGSDTTAVNFAANTPEFFKLKPRHYVLADPHFFGASDSNVDLLWSNLAKTDWPMTLHVPVREAGRLKNLNPHLGVQGFNMTPGEGYDGICHTLYGGALAMPRPRNVLIPAIMEGIRDGYDEIAIVGADHTWPHTLYVDDLNRVVSVQPHFYEENPKELDRIAREYAGRRLHDVMESMVVAFKSYHRIERYARRKGVKIYNATPGSLIDAFERRRGL